MSFPISLLAVVYLILVGVFMLYSFFNLYHLLRFGSPAAVTLTIAFLYLAGSAVLLASSVGLLLTVDWSAHIQLLPAADQFSW